jgi:two-component system, chemotaxis family, chemotaxis protein CheY
MAEPKMLSILVVEDRPLMLKIERRMLKELAYFDVDEAANGREALEKLKSKTYGLILSDWNMDDLSGFDLLQAVRGGATHRHVPFILVTAEAKPENVLAAKAAGADGYLVKPFEVDLLRQTIDHVLAEKRA